MSSPASVSQGRIEGLDLARALAILVMVLINFQVFLLDRPDDSLSDFAERWLIHLPSGRSSSLFVMLAGAGIALMARAPSRRAVQFVLLKRALFLLVSGNLLVLVWWIDILHFYAFYLAFAALVFVAFSNRELILAAVVLALFSGLIGVAFDFGRLEYWSLRGMPVDIFLDGIHALLPWLSFLLIGMWLGRQDLRDGGFRRRLMLGAAALAASAELTSVALSTLATEHAWPPTLGAQLGTSWSPEPLFVFSASGTALFTIAACQEIVEHRGQSRVVRALIATGQVSLTLYLLHALVGVGVPRWLMGLEDGLGWRSVTIYWFVFCALTVPLAHLYRSRFSRGPLEWLMRKLCGQTPPAEARGLVASTGAMTSSPPRWPWAFVGAAWLAIALFRVVGVQEPTWGCGEPGRLGPRVASELTVTCPQRSFVFELDEDRDAVFETHSSHDLMLYLYGPTKRIAIDDDSGLELNPRLERHLRAGTYRLVVRPYNRALGSFSLVFE